MRNLLYLLQYALHVPIREYSLAPLSQHHQDWFEGLISLFATHLLEEWQRGPYRQYQEMKDDLPFLKGKLDINQQLRHPERKHRFSITYDEFTVDIPLNRVFRFVVERLLHITQDAENKLRLDRLRQWMEEVTLLPKITLGDAHLIVMTRLNQRFAPLLELACLFLDHGALQLTTGDLSTYAFVLDMNQLFELFTTSFICHHRYEILPPTLQQCELRPQSHSIVRYLATNPSNGKALFHLKPDLVIYDKECDRFPLLVDMKYKRLTNTNKALGVSRDDFYQMYAYAHRYHCPHILLLYPQTAALSESLHQSFDLVGYEKAIVAATIDIRIDLQRKEEQQKLIDTLKFLLISE
jgi:5-methylcytosine-specific restriction enzyme subunit McrC